MQTTVDATTALCSTVSSFYRFTNEEIADDPQRVLATIERLLVKKRNDEGKLS